MHFLNRYKNLIRNTRKIEFKTEKYKILRSFRLVSLKLLGYCDTDCGHIIENIFFLELLRRDYWVYVGKVGEMEMDFVAEKPNDKIYIQVTESMQLPETSERELRPLRMIPDHYEKIVLSMDRNYINSYDGIKSLNLIDWLLGE